MLDLPLYERLVVAIDAGLDLTGSPSEVRDRVLFRAESLSNTGVILKVETALRICGYDLITQIKHYRVKVFADLKLSGIPSTMEGDAKALCCYEPDIVTVMCSAGHTGMLSFASELEDTPTEVLGVTVPSSFTSKDCQNVFGRSEPNAVQDFTIMACESLLSGVVMSVSDAEVIRSKLDVGLSLNTPGIRPQWSAVAKDDQAGPASIERAVAVADRIIVGRPIVEAQPNNDGAPQSPRDAVMRILDEMDRALS